MILSTNRNFEVQARQGAISNSVSMNTAVAMKIGNSRVGLIAKNPPDSDTTTPLRVDSYPQSWKMEPSNYLEVAKSKAIHPTT